jgi:uncharacterized phiE125 gp8 family phage protein
VALVAHALITLLEAREFLGGDTDGDVVRIEGLIAAASEYCERKACGPLKSRAWPDEVFDGDGSRELVLTQEPVTGVAAVAFLKNTGPVEWDTVVLADYPVVIVTPARRRIAFRNAVFPCGFQNVRVTYTAGYGDAGNVAPVPEILKEACKQAVKELYEAKDEEGEQAITVGAPTGTQTTTYLDRAMPKTTLDVLETFRRRRYG